MTRLLPISSRVVLSVNLCVAILLFSACSSQNSSRERDAKAIETMISGSLKSALDKALREDDVLLSEWLSGPVLGTLRLEAEIVRKGSIEKVGLSEEVKLRWTNRELLDLPDYEETLVKALTPKEHKQLLDFRKTYQYAQYVDPTIKK